MEFRQRIDAFVTRRAHDPLAAKLADKIVERATHLLSAEQLKHQTDMPAMLSTSRAAIGRIFSWAAAWRLTGDTRFVAAARAELLNVATFPEWGPEHFLGVAEMSVAVSVGYSFFYDELSGADRDVLREALSTKVLAHAEKAYAPDPGEGGNRWRAFGTSDTGTNNWNQVCNGGLLAAALVMEPQHPELARLVTEGVKGSLPRAMVRYAPDGAWPEGPVYWGYATTYNVLALALLDARYGNTLGLAELPGFDRTANFVMQVFGPSRKAFNYGDSGAMDSDGPSLQAPLFWLGEYFKNPAATGTARERLAIGLANSASPRAQGPAGGEDRFLTLNAIWFPSAQPGKEMASVPAVDVHFRGITELAILRGSPEDPAALCVALKAGTNGFAHGHLDLGSFILEAHGQRWALDLGPDNYRLPGYWEDENGGRRWNYFRLNNRSHNTLTIKDRLQPAQATALIVAFKSDPRFAFAITDLSAAYPETGGRIRRGVAMIDRARVLVSDEFRGSAANEAVSWRMATDAEVSIIGDGRVAVLKKKGKQIHAQLLAPSSARFTTKDAAPETAVENQNKGIRLLMIESVTGGGNLDIQVLFTPGSPSGQSKPTFPAAPPLDQW